MQGYIIEDLDNRIFHHSDKKFRKKPLKNFNTYVFHSEDAANVQMKLLTTSDKVQEATEQMLDIINTLGLNEDDLLSVFTDIFEVETYDKKLIPALIQFQHANVTVIEALDIVTELELNDKLQGLNIIFH